MTPAPSRIRVVAIVAALVLVAGTSALAKSKHLHAPKPPHGAQMTIGPVTVPHGSEITECTYFKMPHRHDMSVNRVKIKVRGGSHHIHLYRPVDHSVNLPDGHETCNMALDFSVWELVLASQSLSLDWKLPPGVAFHFKGGEQLAAQTHFVDNGLLATPEDGWAVFNLYSMPERKVRSYAGAFFGQDRDVMVPPHSTATATTKCVFPHPVKMLAVTGHYHFRGVHFTAGTWDGTSGSEIYNYNGYLDPPFVRYGENELEVPGLQWTCTYQNDTDNTFTFGPFTDKNEHCNIFAFYYPAVGTNEFMTCVQKDQVVTVDVKN
jgi:hypothetical protein